MFLEAGGSSVTFDVGISTDIDAFCDGVDGNADAIYNFHPTAAGINTVIATDAIQVKILGANSAVVRFRVIALIADIGDPTKLVPDCCSPDWRIILIKGAGQLALLTLYLFCDKSNNLCRG